MSKKLIIFCLILVLFSTISFVSANDVNATNQNALSTADSVSHASNTEVNNLESGSADNGLLNVENNDTVLKESNIFSFSELNTKIANTATGGTLELEEGEVYINNDNYANTGILINKKITINGNGAVIDANGKGRIFQITGGNVVLNNITFINGEINQGGAIYWNGATGIVNNSVFKYNTATQHGGAIYWNKATGTVDNCTFLGNIATSYGSAIYWNQDTGKLINSNFTENYAGQGAVRWAGTGGIISNNIFKKNYATAYGGAIRTDNAVTIINNEFIENTSPNGGDIMTASNHKVIIDNCSFYGSRASSSGGSIHQYDGQLNIVDSVFNTTYAVGGGAIYTRNYGTNRLNLNISNTNFTMVETGASHGTVKFDANALFTIDDCYFINNTASVSGNAVGAGIYITRTTNNTTLVSNCHFINNTGARGVLYFDGIGNIKDCTFIGNKADSTSTLNSGNCIYLTKISYLSGCDFINNTGVKPIIYINNANINYTISDCNFINNTNNNTNGVYGGVVYTNCDLTITNSNFSNNNISSNGGAIFTTNNLTVNGSTFTDNSAAGNGGAIYTNPSSTVSFFTVKNSVFNKNKAGSVISVEYDENQFNAILYSYNNLMNAIYLTRVADLTLSNNTYWNGENKINTDSEDYTNFNPSNLMPLSNEIINITIFNNENEEILSTTSVTDENGQVTIAYGEYTNCKFVFSYEGSEEYAFASKNVTTSIGGDFFELQKFITSKIEAGENIIKLNRNYTYTNGVDTIVNGVLIDKDNIIIDGDDFTVDANHSSRIFNITGNNVILKNIFLVNGSASNGGAIHWTGINGSIQNLTFINNVVTSYGGAVYWNSYNGTVYNSTFSGNNATTYGGSLYMDVPTSDYYDVLDNFIVNGSDFSNGHTNSWGGAIFFQRSGIVDSSTFEDLYSTTGAGALYANRQLYVQNSKFNNTHSGSTGGGAICQNWGSVLALVGINNCIFNNSYATYGGAVRVYGNVSVNDSVFTNCYATTHSGVLIMENRGNSSFINCAFDNNHAPNVGLFYLRGAYSEIINCNFTNNNENTTGNGNIYMSTNTPLYIHGSIFINNSAVNGGVIRTFGVLTVNSSNFINNNATFDGGVIYTTGVNLTIEDSQFIDNGANRGSAVYSTSTNINITSSYFKNNTVSSFIVLNDNEDTNEYTAVLYQRNNFMNAFYITGVTNLTVSGSAYWNRTETVNVDGEYTEIDTSYIKAANEIITVTISNNDETKSITDYITDSDGKIDSINYAGYNNDKFTFRHIGLDAVDYDSNVSVIAGNSNGFNSLQVFLDAKIAEGETLIFLNKNYTYDLETDTIINGVSITADNIIIDGNGFTVDANYSSRIFNITGKNVTLQNFKFINGISSGNGGAIYWTSADGVINNSEFINNTVTTASSSLGGAIYSPVKLSIFNSNFTDNNASYRGGAVYVNAALTLDNCTFINNTAINHGGAVTLNGAANITYCKFINNTANAAAGAIYNINGGTGNSAGGKISYSEFTNNTAGTNGGALYLTPTQTTVTYCNFTNNSAATGGAIYNYHRQLTTTYCNYDNNNATGEGGAIYIYSYNANYQSTITGCNFTSNNGTIGGAVRTRGSLVIKDSNFINNTATTGSGGACNMYSWNVITNPSTTTNCNFTGNAAKTEGGAVYCIGTYTVSSSNFKNNSATKAGAIYNTGVTLTINSNSNFTNNSVSGEGGAVYTNCSILVVQSCNFKNNTADKGSVFYLNNDFMVASFIKNNFEINQANSDFSDRVDDGENLTATLSLYDHIMSALYCNNIPLNLILINDNYWNGSEIVNSNYVPAFDSLSNISSKRPNKTVTVYVKDDNNQTIDTVYLTTDDNGQVSFNYANAIFDSDPRLIIFKFESEPDYYRDGDFTGAFSFGSAFDSLQELINSEIAKGHYEINLTRDFIYDVGFDTITGGIFINADNLIIDGRGHIIDAMNLSRIFYINATQNIILKNMVLRNANVNSSNYINLNKSLIKFNETQGGAIYIANNVSDFVIDHLDFINTTSSDVGGSIYAVNVTNLNITNCIFINTTSSIVGSAIQFDAAYNIIIRNCKFNNSDGGCIMLNSGEYNTIRDCSFNNVMMANGQQNIGTIRVDRMENSLIENCNFSNSYGYWGVGVRIARTGNGYLYNLTINNCTFYNLTNPSAGGAVYTAGHNSGDNVSYVQIYNCYFEACSQGGATGRGSAMELNAHHSSVVNCTFKNNIAAGAGTIGLYSTASYAYIANCVFINNTALGNAGGGAISAELAACNNANIFNCTFINNSAPNSKGGALVFNARDSSITNCTFMDNYALTHGGAISFNANNGYILRCSFINNRADGDGGAICSYSVNNTIDNCTFDSNTAPDGPDFYAHPGCSLVFVGTVFSTIFVGDDNLPADYSVSNSHGLRSGDPITWDTAFSYLESVGITENIEIILINNNDNAIGVPTTITNFAEKIINIPGVTVRGWNSSSIVNLSGWNHRAFTVNASGVTFAHLTFIDSNIQNCSDNDGGVLKFINGDGGQIINCTFTGNYAVTGGAISLNNSEEGRAFLVESCMFNYNNATGNGGAIWINNVTNLTMVLNSYFQHNRALDGYSAGGGIYYQPSIRYYVDEFTQNKENSFDNQLNITNDNPLDGPSLFTDNSQTLLKYIYVSWANGDSNSNGSEWDHPTTFSRGFELIAPTGTIYFVGPETYDYGRIFHGTEHIVDCEKFNITFSGNNSVITGISMHSIAGFGYGLVIANLTFANNNFTPIINDANDNVIVNCNFVDNNCSAIINQGANLIINNTAFSNNNMTGNGAAIYSNSYNLTIDNCNFTNNTATMGGSHIYLTENSTNTIISNSRFNDTSYSGIISYANDLQINNSIFTNNTGLYGGALLILNGTNVILTNNKFTKNSAIIGGGAIFTNVSIIINNCNFTENNANLGGALYINASDCNLSDLNFIGNTADIGAAIFFDNVSSVIFKNSTFISNIANNEGIVYFNNNANIYNDVNLIFADNTPGNKDVNVVAADGVELNATIFFVNNITNAGATGIAAGIDATSLQYACEHILDGGKIIFANAVYVLDDAINISNKTVTLIGNGSSIRRTNSKYLFITNNSNIIFEDLLLDAGIDVCSGNVDLNNITFTATDTNAGGIIYEADSTGKIVNSNFTGSTNLNDPYLVIINGNVDIDNTEFSNNNAGALHHNGSGSITNSIFIGNNAENVVRNINVTNLNDVEMSNNTLDAILNYSITNTTHGSKADIVGTYDAGVNFDIKDVKFMINDTQKTNKTADVRNDGKFTFDVSGLLDVGTYNLTVADNHHVIYETSSFAVTKNVVTANSIVSVTVSYGDNNTINIRGTVNGSSYARYNGKINVTISNNVNGKEIHLYDVKVNNNNFNANVVDKGTLTVGKYNVTISCNYDENFDFITAIFTNNVTVIPATIAVQSVEDMTVVYGNNDSIVVRGSVNSTKFGVNYTGRVTVVVDGQGISGSGVVDNNGNFAVVVNNAGIGKLDVAKYGVVVSIDGAANYNAVSGKLFADKLNVVNASIAVQSVEDMTVVYGNNDSIVVKGSVNNTKFGDNYTGLVTVAIGGTQINGSNATCDNGNFTVWINDPKIKTLNVNNYDICVEIRGNSNYNHEDAVTFSNILKVTPAKTSISVDIDNVVYNNTAIISFNVTNTDSDAIIPSENVNITVMNDSGIVYTVNSTTDGDNVDLPLFNVGNYTVTITYEGDDNFMGNTSSREFNVTIMPTSISLDDIYVVVGNNVTVTTVNITDGSNITLKVNGKTYNGEVYSNKASILIDEISSTGTFEANVTYTGTNNRNASFILSDLELINPNSLKALQLLIDNSNDTVILDHNYTYDPNTDGENGIIVNKSITIDGNGSIIDSNGSSPVFTITSDNVNISDITYTNANGTIIDVNANNVTISNSSFINNTITNSSLIDASGTNGTILSDNDFKDNNLTNSIAVDVSDSNKTTIENISFNDNNILNATLIDASNASDPDISGTEIKDNNMTGGVGIDVSGSNGSSVGNTSVSGNDVEGGSVIDASNSHGSEITNVNLINNTLSGSTAINVENASSVNISDSTFSNNSVVDNSSIINIVNSDNVKLANLSITNNTLDSSSSILNIKNSTVDSDDSAIVIDAYDLIKYYGASDKFVASITTLDNTPLTNKTVNITINGVDYTRVSDENGLVSISINLGSGIYPVVVSVNNKTANALITVLSTVNGTNIVKYYCNDTQFYATFLDNEGNYLAEGTAVSFNINGVFYTSHINGSEGLAKLNINLLPDDYIITSINLVTGEKHSNNITVLPVILADDLVKYYRNGSQFIVTVVDQEGSIATNGTVSFNVNGVFYERNVNASGNAKLNINLLPGDYIITSTYNNCSISNNITVLPVILGDDLVKYYRNGSQYVVSVIDGNGDVINNGTVSFNVNGVFYKRNVNASGNAKLNINLPPGDYIITSYYNNCVISNSIKVLPVLSASDLTKKQGSSDQFVVKLVDGQGNPYPGQRISFNIGGSMYYRTTDASGIAKLNINLVSGRYIITSSYNGLGTANTITVTN